MSPSRLSRAVPPRPFPRIGISNLPSQYHRILLLLQQIDNSLANPDLVFISKQAEEGRSVYDINLPIQRGQWRRRIKYISDNKVALKRVLISE